MKRKLLATSDIKNILTQYDIGDYKSRRFINTTIENQNYKLITTKGVYLLKVFDTDDVKSLNVQSNLLEYLEKQTIKVPTLVKNKNKENLSKHKNRYLTIYTFVQGTHIKRLTAGLCKSMACEIARLHGSLFRYEFKGTRRIPTYYRQEDLAMIGYKRLRQSVIHGDLGKSNILQKEQRVTAIIDFNDAHWDFLIKDLAVMMPIFLNKTNAKYLPVFLKEYQQYFKLDPTEIKSLPFFTRAHIKGVLEWLAKQTTDDQTTAQLEHVQKAIRHFTKSLKNIIYLRMIDQQE